MNTAIKKLLAVLGMPTEERKSRYRCPLHSRDSFTLAFLRYDNTIMPCGYRVKCDDPKCGFDGTVYDLLAKVTEKPRSEVMSAFLSGGDLHDTFTPTTHNRGHDRAIVEDHMVTLHNDRVAKDYLLGCKSGLLACSDLRVAMVKFGIQENYIQNMACGKYDPLLPDDLAVTPPKTGKNESLVCPYTYGGLVTGLSIVDPNTGIRNEIPILGDHEKFGIFQEEIVSPGDVVYECSDELTAMLVRSKFLEFTDKPSRAMCLRSHEAALHLPDDVSIVLLSPPDRILPFAKAATYWMHLRDKRTVKVVELPRRLSGFAGINLSKVLNAEVDLSDWLVDHLAKVNHKSGPTEVTKVVSAVGLRNQDRSDLIKLLKEAGHDDPLFLSAVRNAKLVGSLIKYSGSRIRRNSASYVDVTKGNRVLSNFVFYADTMTKDKSGKPVIIGRIKTSDPSLPMCNVSFRTSELVNPHGSKVTEKFWAQMQEQGISYPIWAAELHGGITWFNVLAYFDNPEYKGSVAALGTRDEGTLGLPKVRLDFMSGEMKEGGYMYGIEPVAASMYSEIGKSASYDAEVLKVLLESNNQLTKRVCAVLGHVLHQMVASAVLGTKFVPRHLILPYAIDDDLWYNVLSQASCILGGSPRPPLVPASAAEMNAVIKVNEQLNTLPGIYLSRSGANKKIMDWMFSSKNSLILGVPEGEVVPFGREDVTYLMYDEDDVVGHKSLLSHEVMDAVRDALPHIMLKAAEDVDVAVDTNPNVLPVHRGLKWLAEAVDAKLPEEDFVISDYYSMSKQNGLELFIRMMAKEVVDGRVPMSATRGEYRADDSYMGYYHKNLVVFHSRRSVEYLKGLGVEFSSRHLRDICVAEGWMRNKQREDIPIGKEVWEEHVKPLKSRVLTKKDLKLTLVS